ncbi:MAG: YfhO family protein [Chloroflexota bacterium]|nr:YfhO family protein [Chloroflexota bacterium]
MKWDGIRNSQFAIRYGPLAVLLIFPLLLLWRALFAGEAFFWGTPLLQFVPWQRMAAEMWQAGHLPLWNPLVGCGAPLAANYQTAAFYPLNLLYLLLPAEVALGWTTALHLALAGWGMYRWGRAVGLDRFPALIGSLALSGSGFLVARAALFPSIAFTFPWLTVWLWRAEALVRSGRLRETLWLGLVLGLGLLAGHAQTAFYGGVLLAAYLAFRTGQEARDKKGQAGGWSLVIARWSLVACAFVIGLGMAAVQLLPTAELAMLSQRSAGVDYDFAMTYSLWPWRLITFVAPDFFGNPGRGDYVGYATYWEDAGYIGVLPLLMAAGAVFGRKQGGQGEGETRRQGDKEMGGQWGRGAGLVWFWTVGVVITLVLALGKNTPVFPFLFHHVPGFDMFQAPARWMAVTTIALAALAALGAQSWPTGRYRQRQGALLMVGVALLIGGLAAPRLVPEVWPTFGPATARLGGTLAVVGVLAFLRRDVAVRLNAYAQVWWRVAVVVFVALDLLLFGWPLVPTVDRALYHGGTETAAFLHGETVPVRVYWPTDPTHLDREYDAEYRVKYGYLRCDPICRDFVPREVDYWWEMRESLLPNVGMLDGVYSANNFEPLMVGRYGTLLEAAVESPDLLRVMGVTHVANSELRLPNGEPRFYRLPDALGRAWVVPVARQVSPDEMLMALVDPAFDPAAEVLLERAEGREQGAEGRRQEAAPGIQRPASSVEYQVALQDAANQVTIHAILDTPGYLVLADTWYPGWQATVDGEPAPVLRANYAFRAVWLGAGEHVVEFVYRPRAVMIGIRLSVGSLICLFVGWLVGRVSGLVQV